MLKEKSYRSRPYLNWIKTLPCAKCGRETSEYLNIGSDPAHFRDGKNSGMGNKPPDNMVLPLCRKDHEDQHCHNNTEWLLDMWQVDNVEILYQRMIHLWQVWKTTENPDVVARALLREWRV